MKLIYTTVDRKFASLGTNDVPGEGQASIEITDTDLITAIQRGGQVTINESLEVSVVPVVEREAITAAKSAVAGAVNIASQRNAMIDLLILERGYNLKDL